MQISAIFFFPLDFIQMYFDIGDLCVKRLKPFSKYVCYKFTKCSVVCKQLNSKIQLCEAQEVWQTKSVIRSEFIFLLMLFCITILNHPH